MMQMLVTNFSRIGATLLLAVVFTIGGCSEYRTTASHDENSTSTTSKSIVVEFEHIANTEGESVAKTLTMHKDSDGDIQSYSMTVESVYCGEDVCKVDPVTMYWNPYGQYTHYSLIEGIELEKGNALPFEAADYDKLHDILLNPENSLRYLVKEELVSEKRGGNAVDALSGATIAMNKNDYVEQAIWTCFTLWHFAHGPVSQIARDFTGAQLGEEKLLALVASGVDAEVTFALEQLTLHQANNERVISVVFNALSQRLNQSNASPLDMVLLQAYLNYLSQLQHSEFHQHVIVLFDRKQNWLYPHLLKVLSDRNADDEGILSSSVSQIAMSIDNTWKPQHIHQFLTLLNGKPYDFSQINQALTNVLNTLDFISARSLYWFLVNQTLSDEQNLTLVRFSQSNRERL
ncbi:hypothetical protein [Alteromonas sp. KUL49]|uniref:hypothetical protein n=1 Tax=Alteromonas sp. KUL49 TaxID=2480798 RepID=UPI00102EF491|nr:hypothetical protein [Alteromonas sp. KUL49]TAP35929.1 hypothetical protein EYS00_18190 [Alteromonas sp. KUL49]GEA13320.1 hypothetical protein KUL49_36950 [Alteromonas sp. KUL49]